MCRVSRMNYDHSVLFKPTDAGAFIFLTLLLPNLSANIVFVRAVLLWCGTLYIVNALVIIEQVCHVLRMECVHSLLFRPTDAGTFIFLTLLLPNLNANIVFVRAALLWCGTLYIVTALEVIEQMCRVLLLKYV